MTKPLRIHANVHFDATQLEVTVRQLEGGTHTLSFEEPGPGYSGVTLFFNEVAQIVALREQLGKELDREMPGWQQEEREVAAAVENEQPDEEVPF